ncbi:MAG: efflux RND transporter permease subunit [Nevskiales bacterium]|nr:efflux RND transporter permease subunit [Nevskiales bacterium]
MSSTPGGLRYRIADWTLNHRRALSVLFVLITLGFAAGLPGVRLQTIFSDLLPRDDPFVQVFQDHPNFGSPLTMLVVVRRLDGDIYNAETIQKVWKLTRDIDLAPGVNHDQILSITTTKARYAEATQFGIDMRPLMGDVPPADAASIERFRDRVRKAPKVARFLISEDEHATLIGAAFIEHRIDYGETFEYVQNLVENARDAHHEVYLAGQPALIGWVYRYEHQMIAIFAVTLVALFLALIVYMRSTVAILTPLISGSVAAIWAFGFVGWLDISIEPLLMVVPLLLAARSFSHCVQFVERYNEIRSSRQLEPVEAAKQAMAVMMSPSIVSILTDFMGIVVVAAAPIESMVRHAIFCGMWALWLIPTGIFLIPILLTVFPQALVTTGGTDTRRHVVRDAMAAALERLARLVTGRHAVAVAVALGIVSAFVIHTANQVKIGNPVEGSSLFWPDAEFNRAVHAINRDFPGVNTLEIVLEAKDGHGDEREWIVQKVDTVMTMLRLQKLMERSPDPPEASLSYADYLEESNRLFQGGNHKWQSLDPVQRSVSATSIGTMMGSSADAYGHVISRDMRHATVSFWFRDNKQATVDTALRNAQAAVDAVGTDHPEFTVRLGTGTIALQEAVNRVVERYHWTVLGLLNLTILLMCGLAYRSVIAGLLLLIPVNLSNFTLIAAMEAIGVGLDVNSLIVAAIGLGVGIDYGIYLLSRICEKMREPGARWEHAIRDALTSTGQAIMFTASVMAIAIFPWYLMSGLKFVADMGLLLVVVMAINMFLSLILLPLEVYLVKPRFVLGRQRPATAAATA